eukprot:Hpha_TRINITY_DN16209_c1_g17::TRINITY_DN16209_c1_g17_i1::g.13995::m.13995
MADQKGGGLMLAEDMVAELRQSWHAMVSGYARLRHGLADLAFPPGQLAALAGLMRYAKILLATALASLTRYRTVNRSALPSLAPDLEFDAPVSAGVSEGDSQQQGDTERAAAAAGLSGVEHSHLREVVSALCGELVHERQQRGTLAGQLAKYNTVAGDFRAEADLTLALRGRLRDLQVGSNLDGDVHPHLPDPQPLVSEATALNTVLKEQHDRLRAESLKLRADKFALLAEKGLLLERVRALEARAVAAAQTSGHYRRTLEKVKRRNITSAGSTAGASPSPLLRPASSAAATPGAKSVSTVDVGGVSMEPEVVDWLKEMYQVLSQEGDEGQGESVRRIAGPQASGSLASPAGHNVMSEDAVSQEPPTPPQESKAPPRRNFAVHVAEVRQRKSR